MSVFTAILNVIRSKASRWTKNVRVASPRPIRQEGRLTLEKLETRECPATLAQLGNAIANQFTNQVNTLVSHMAVVETYAPSQFKQTLVQDISRIYYWNRAGNMLNTLRELDVFGKHVVQEIVVVAAYRLPVTKTVLYWGAIRNDIAALANTKVLIAAYCNYVAARSPLNVSSQASYTLNTGLFNSATRSPYISDSVQSYYAGAIQNAVTNGWNRSNQASYNNYFSQLGGGISANSKFSSILWYGAR